MLKKFSKYITFENILLLFIVIVFFFALRWNHFTAPFERDEGVHAYSSWIMREGKNPYEYSFPYRFPMIIYTYSFGQSVFGDNVFSPRILATLFSLLTIIIVGLIAKKEHGMRAFWSVLWLLSIMLILPVNFGRGHLADIYYAANAEIFMLLPLLAFVYLYVVKKDKASVGIWFLSGVLGTIAIAYKPICMFVIAYVYVFWIVKTIKVEKDVIRLLLKLVAAFFGAALSTLLIFLPFVVHDGGEAIWNQLVGFTPCRVQMESWDFGIGQLINRVIIMSKYYWALYLLVIYYLYKRPKNWIFYTGLLVVSFFSVYQSLIGHYFLLVMPFFALISSFSLTLLSKEKRFKNIPFWILVGIMVLTILWPVRSTFGKTPEELGVWVYGNYDQHVEAELVGEKIAEITRPDDYIYVQGMDPEILYFAHRKHSVKFEWTYYLFSGCKMLDSYREEYIADLEKNTPEAITICVSGSCRYIWEDEKTKEFMEYLSDMLESNYVAVGGWIPKEDGSGYWLDLKDNTDYSGFRTILFKRTN